MVNCCIADEMFRFLLKLDVSVLCLVSQGPKIFGGLDDKVELVVSMLEVENTCRILVI